MARIRIGAVGDIKITGPLRPSPVYDILKAATVATANLECPFTSHKVPADKLIVSKASPRAAEQLRGLGLRVVSIANNHALDYTEKGLMDTIRHVTRHRIKTVGGGKNLAQSLAPARIKAGGAEIAFFGVACTLPAGFAATEQRPGIAPIRIQSSYAIDSGEADEQPGSSPFVHTRAVQEDLEAVIGTIKKAKKWAELVVISIHWGVTPGWQPVFQGTLAEYQAPLGRSLIDAGADIVLGHHPHVLNGIETYRHGIIFYSLGHFIFQSAAAPKRAPDRMNQVEVTSRQGPGPFSPYTVGTRKAVYAAVKRLISSPEARESMVVRIEAECSKGRKPRLTGVEITPCILDPNGEPVEGNPEQARNILARLRFCSKEFGTEIVISQQKGYIKMAGPLSRGGGEDNGSKG